MRPPSSSAQASSSGHAASRITEDYLRILRYFRFHARYAPADAPPDPEATTAIAANTAGLAQLSPERVWSELKRILATPAPLPALTLMQTLGVLPAILPESTTLAPLQTALRAGAPPDPILRLAALIAPRPAHADATDPLARRLRLSTAEATTLAQLATGPAPTPADSDDTLRRLLADTPSKILIGRSFLAGAPTPHLAALPRPVFPLEGRHALALGARPGPKIGAALRDVRAWWLAAGCLPDEAACLARLVDALSNSVMPT